MTLQVDKRTDWVCGAPWRGEEEAESSVSQEKGGQVGVAVPQVLEPACPWEEAPLGACHVFFVGFFLSAALIRCKLTEVCVPNDSFQSRLLTREGEREEGLGVGETLWLGSVPWEWA